MNIIWTKNKVSIKKGGTEVPDPQKAKKGTEVPDPSVPGLNILL